MPSQSPVAIPASSNIAPHSLSKRIHVAREATGARHAPGTPGTLPVLEWVYIVRSYASLHITLHILCLVIFNRNKAVWVHKLWRVERPVERAEVGAVQALILSYYCPLFGERVCPFCFLMAPCSKRLKTRAPWPGGQCAGRSPQSDRDTRRQSPVTGRRPRGAPAGRAGKRIPSVRAYILRTCPVACISYLKTCVSQ